jgi:hypothetical protein
MFMEIGIFSYGFFEATLTLLTTEAPPIIEDGPDGLGAIHFPRKLRYPSPNFFRSWWLLMSFTSIIVVSGLYQISITLL